jgi:hypothetical protein
MPSNRSITSKSNRINPKAIPSAIAIRFTMKKDHRNGVSVSSAQSCYEHLCSEEATFLLT